MVGSGSGDSDQMAWEMVQELKVRGAVYKW